MRSPSTLQLFIAGTFLILGAACSGTYDGGSVAPPGGYANANPDDPGDDDPGDFDPGTTSSGGGGSSAQPGDGFCGTELTGTVRDFSVNHPDFEYTIAVDQGFVAQQLGADGKPVYTGGSGTVTTNGAAFFDQWYRNVPGVNQAIELTINLEPGGSGIYTYDSSSFFPIDGQGFGNEGNAHNYHFTFELHTKFLYQGGEVFSFTGDDDLFTFINGRLAIDLGGVHGAMSQSIDLDEHAAELGLVPGSIYNLDFFFAERHTTESNFRIDTSISFVDCGGAELN